MSPLDHGVIIGVAIVVTAYILYRIIRLLRTPEHVLEQQRLDREERASYLED